MSDITSWKGARVWSLLIITLPDYYYTTDTYILIVIGHHAIQRPEGLDPLWKKSIERSFDDDALWTRSWPSQSRGSDMKNMYVLEVSEEKLRNSLFLYNRCVCVCVCVKLVAIITTLEKRPLRA